MKNQCKLIILLALALALALTGCAPVTFNILSNNNLFTTRSQATASGEQLNETDGGGTTDANLQIPLK